MTEIKPSSNQALENLEKSQNKRKSHPKRQEFIEFLENLKALDDKNRGDYTALKRAAGTIIGESQNALAAFYKILPYSALRSPFEPVYYLIATLFPINKSTRDGNFGKTMRLVKINFESESIDNRFKALLDVNLDLDHFKATPPDLDEFRVFSYRIRQCVSLAASKDVGISWLTLLEDLYWWIYDPRLNKSTQKAWTREYFGKQKENTKQDGKTPKKSKTK